MFQFRITAFFIVAFLLSATFIQDIRSLKALDPKSELKDFQTDATRRFDADTKSQTQLAETEKLSEVNASDYDAIFYPGGHGPLWDLVNDQNSIQLIESFWAENKPVSRRLPKGPLPFGFFLPGDR